MVITVSLQRTETQHLSQLEDTTETVGQAAVRSLTHHRVGGHRNPGAVGEVVEDAGRSGQQVAADRTHTHTHTLSRTS